jgi:hypothetical protein
MTRATFGGGTFGSGVFGGGPFGDDPSREWSVAIPTVGATDISSAVDVSLTAAELSLSFPTQKAAWDTFETVGDTETVETHGGAWRTLRRDDGDPVPVEPPDAAAPGVETTEWVPLEFESEQLNPSQRRVELTLRRPAPRGGAPDETASTTTSTPNPKAFGGGAFGAGAFGGGAAAYSFGLAAGEFISVTRDGVIETAVAAAPGAPDLTVPLILTSGQLGTLATVADLPNAVVERPVPDGTSERVDSSPADRQTVTVETPSDAPFDSGTYLIADWEATPVGSLGVRDRWRCELTLVDKS